METKDIIEDINYLIRIIPDFITGIDDKEVYDNMITILNILKKLCIPTFISDQYLEHLIGQAEFYFNKISNFPDKQTRLDAFRYLNDIMDTYIETTEEEELFEICSNFKKFKNFI